MPSSLPSVPQNQSRVVHAAAKEVFERMGAKVDYKVRVYVCVFLFREGGGGMRGINWLCPSPPCLKRLSPQTMGRGRWAR